MHRLFSSIIRTSAFLRKEIVEVLRQPRLLLTLVLGPFLILLIFGLGYRNQPRELRTLFVVQNSGALGENIRDYATTLGPQLVFAGATEDLVSALSQLQRGEVDLVAVTPEDPFEKIRNDQQAIFTLYHREIDPFQVDYVNYFGQIYIDEVNRRVLTNITEQGQTEASTVQDDIQAARQDAAAMRQALEQGNTLAAQERQTELSENLDAASLALGASLSLLNGVQQEVGTEENDYIELIKSNLSDIRQTTGQLDEFAELSSASSADIQEVSRIEEDLADLESQIEQFTSISPFVLVRPFASETKGIAPTQPGPVEFYAPAVIALLLQHLAVTFGALSIVRENDIGAMELFRVSPISAAETLLGKYLSYFIFTVLLTAILTALLILGIGLPMLGNWLHYALIITILLFTSLGIGFLISLVSHTDSQAVQLTMIVLLASVFFSGFLLDLQLIWDPVKVLSWSLPTTYGIAMIRDIFLLGQPPDVVMVTGLFGLGIAFMLISWFLLRREIASE